MITIKAYGDQALLIEFPEEIALRTHRKIVALQKLLKPLTGVRYTIPAYCSITVVYDTEQTNFDLLKAQISAVKMDETEEAAEGKHIKIPVCYERPFAPDIDEVATFAGLSKSEIIKLHSEESYHVYMMGFIPGFPYLGKLDEKLFSKRKAQPRKNVPKGSVGLAGLQTGIYPAEAPGGWQIIGRTPIPIFRGDLANPFLFKTGDKVSFYPINAQQFESLEKQALSGDLSGFERKDFHE